MSIIKKIAFTTLLWTLAFIDIWAQCPMCKAAAESNLKEGGTAALGLNQGILYLFLTPFCIAGTLICLWFWFHRKGNTNTPTPIEAKETKVGQLSS